MPFSWLDVEFIIKDKLEADSRETPELLTQFPLTSIIPEDTSIDHFRQIPYQAFEDHIKLQLLKSGKIIGKKFRWSDSLRENVVEFDDRHGFHLMLKRFESEGTHLRSRRINIEVKTVVIYTEAGQRADDIIMREADNEGKQAGSILGSAISYTFSTRYSRCICFVSRPHQGYQYLQSIKADKAMKFRFWKACPQEAHGESRDLDWSEVDFEVKYLAFPHVKILRFPVTAIMTNVDEEEGQHWTDFSFDRFVEVVERKRVAKGIPKAAWIWYSSEKMDRFEITDEDEFHVFLKRFKRDYVQRQDGDTIKLSMIRGPEKTEKRG